MLSYNKFTALSIDYERIDKFCLQVAVVKHSSCLLTDGFIFLCHQRETDEDDGRMILDSTLRSCLCTYTPREIRRKRHQKIRHPKTLQHFVLLLFNDRKQQVR